MITQYPLRCIVVVGLLSFLSVTLRDRTAQDVTALPSSDSSSTVTIVGKATVTDGDSLRINDGKIRLWGIDAPELQQFCQQSSATWPCGIEAKKALTDRIGQQSVFCRQEDVDRYGRSVAECYVGDVSLNEWLVEEGWALAYRRYSTKFIPAENQAKFQQAGMWRGEFIEPWEWRRQRR